MNEAAAAAGLAAFGTAGGRCARGVCVLGAGDAVWVTRVVMGGDAMMWGWVG